MLGQSIAGHASGPQHSTAEPATLTLLLPYAYDKALKQLRAALHWEGLQISMEMDVTESIHASLGVGLGKCRLLCVTCPYVFLQTVVADAAGLTALPLHLVVYESKPGTRVSVPNPARLDSDLPAGLSSKIQEVGNRLVRCINAISEMKFRTA